MRNSLGMFGLDIVRLPTGRRAREESYPPDFSEFELEIIENVRPITLTSPERIYALIQASRYVSCTAIPGAIVECGVWQGGSMAAIARTLIHENDLSRDLYLFDTFKGMTEPGAYDLDLMGQHALKVLRRDPEILCAGAPLEGVKNVMYATGYPEEKIHFIQGRVEETIPAHAPDSIALLRLDTDWYESTQHELVHLYPRLSHGGVIVIDDYGHWQGCRRACDEYFEHNHVRIFLNRIDYTGRIAIKS